MKRITMDFFEKKRDQYREEQKEILAKAKNLQVADEEYYLTSQYLLQIASRAKELFESSEPDEKKQILQLTLQNLTLEGKKVRYEWKKPFDKIAIYASHPDWRPRRDSNPSVKSADSPQGAARRDRYELCSARFSSRKMTNKKRLDKPVLFHL